MSSWLTHLGLCPIKNLTGIPCPGCGMTRAFLSAFKLDFHSALTFHPLFWLVPLIFFVVIFRKRSAFLMKLYQSKWLGYALVALFMGTYLWRMFYLFPQTAPMDVNPYGIVPTIFRYLFS